jgi:hypothetical protein
LDDLALFEELDQIPLNSILSLNSVSCTLASTEDFYLEDKKIPEQEGNPQFSIELKEPSRR